MPIRLDSRSADFAARFAAFLATKRETARGRRAGGARHHRRRAQERRPRADRAEQKIRPRRSRTSSACASPQAEIDAATAACDRRALDALTLARDRIEAYHRRQKPTDDRFTDALGVELGHRWSAIEAVGLYVPGGTAAYPSSVLMNAVPAKVAGVPRVVMVVPAPDGKLAPLVLAAAKLAGVDEVYRIGGAQAVAALAYGTADHQAGGQDRRPRQRLCGGGQAAGVRHRRHRHDRRAFRGADPRRQERQSGLDRRRSAGAGRARHRGAVDPDHRRCARSPTRSRRRSPRSSRRCRAARSPARRGATSARSSLVRKLDDAVPLVDALAPEHLEIETADRRAARRQNPQRRRDLPRRAHARKRSATMSPAPTTCCRPRARRASRRGSACSTS